MHKYEETRKQLQCIFQDTLTCMEKHDTLKQASAELAQATIVYTENIEGISLPGPYLDTIIEVVEDTTFSCA